MSPLPPFASSQYVRLLTLALIVTACQRREGFDDRMPYLLGSDDEWSFSTHPVIPLGGREIRDLTSRAMKATGHFTPAADADLASNGSALSARVFAQIVSAESTPASASSAEPVVTQVHLRFQFIPALSDESSAVTVVVAGSGRGTSSEASRAAISAALGRALDQVTMELRGRAKSDEELVSELHSADPVRMQSSLDRLASRRNPAAFGPLVSALRGDDVEAAQRALSGLVALDDVRGVGPIIQEAERRELPFTLEALYAVGSIGGEDAEGYLFTLTSDSDARVRAAASEALALAQRRATSVRRPKPTGHAPESNW